MTLHPRYRICQAAAAELGMFLSQLIDRHGLTYSEVFGMLGSAISSEAKFAIRDERHTNDTSKRGDEE